MVSGNVLISCETGLRTSAKESYYVQRTWLPGHKRLYPAISPFRTADVKTARMQLYDVQGCKTYP